MSTFTERAERLQKARRALRKAYGSPEFRVPDDPARAMVKFMLLEQTTEQRVDRALEAMDQHLVDLNELRVSFPREIRNVVGDDLPDLDRKTQRIARLLNNIFLRHNTMRWDFLDGMGVRDLRQYFEKQGGPVLGAAAVLLMSDGHAVPADADLCRVLERLELVDEGEDAASVQGFLERAVKSGEGRQVWLLLRRLAEDVCLPGEPKCAGCSLKSMCPTGKRRLAKPLKNKATATAKKTAKSPAKKASASKKTAKKSAKASSKSAKKSAKRATPKKTAGGTAKKKTAAKKTTAKKKSTAKKKAAGKKPAAKARKTKGSSKGTRKSKTASKPKKTVKRARKK